MEYFMDKMEDWELFELFKVLQYTDRNGWEQTRFISYLIAQTNSKKKLQVENIMKFPWDENHKDNNIEISDNEISMLKSLAKEYAKNIKDNNGSTT